MPGGEQLAEVRALAAELRLRQRAAAPRAGRCTPPSTAHYASTTATTPVYNTAMAEATMRKITQRTLGGPEVLELVEAPRPDADADGGARARRGRRRQPGRLEGAHARRLPRRAAVHGRLGRRRGRGGARLRRDAVQPGDRVFGMPRFPREAAAYAEYVTSPSRQLARIPDGLSDVEAGALPLAGLTAWQALVETADVLPGPASADPRAPPVASDTSPCRSQRPAART